MTRPPGPPAAVETIVEAWLEDGAEHVTLTPQGHPAWSWGASTGEGSHLTAGGLTVLVEGDLPAERIARDTKLLVEILDLAERAAEARHRLATVMRFEVPADVDVATTLQSTVDQLAAVLAVDEVTISVETEVGPRTATSAATVADPGRSQEAITSRALPLNRGAGTLSIAGGDDTDSELLEALARRAASAIDLSITYEESIASLRLQNEYELAERVQSRMLPRRSIPQLTGFEIFAESRPARLVGGDFCDFQGGAGRPTFFSVGDVSGKGLPAAILMSMTMATLNNKVEYLPEPTPEAIIARANEDMFSHFTDVGMFATAVVGRLDPESSAVSLANGGHSPVVYKPFGRPPELVVPEGTPLGVLDETFAKDRTLRVAAGDLLVVTSDGLNEQRDSQGEMFGYDRLLATVAALADQPARLIAIGLFSAVRAFAGVAEQDDDQTVLVVRGVPRVTPSFEAELDADLEALRDLPRLLDEAIDRHPGRPAISEDIRTGLELAIHEVLTNIVVHGYDQNPGSITLRFGGDASEIVIDIEDQARAFDPLDAPMPDLETPQVHGYGMFLVRELMDTTEYGRRGQTNHLRLIKHL